MTSPRKSTPAVVSQQLSTPVPDDALHTMLSTLLCFHEATQLKGERFDAGTSD